MIQKGPNPTPSILPFNCVIRSKLHCTVLRRGGVGPPFGVEFTSHDFLEKYEWAEGPSR